MNRFYTSVRSIHPEIRQIIYTFNSALEPETAKRLSNRKPTSDQTNQVKWKENYAHSAESMYSSAQSPASKSPKRSKQLALRHSAKPQTKNRQGRKMQAGSPHLARAERERSGGVPEPPEPAHGVAARNGERSISGGVGARAGEWGGLGSREDQSGVEVGSRSVPVRDAGTPHAAPGEAAGGAEGTRGSWIGGKERNGKMRGLNGCWAATGLLLCQQVVGLMGHHFKCWHVAFSIFISIFYNFSTSYRT